MTFVNTKLPKICHARVGDLVRLPHPETGDVLDEVFLVCAKPEQPKRRTRKTARSTLSYEKDPVFLVSLTTGELREMPHLSSRAALVADAEKPSFECEVVLADTDESKWRHIVMTRLSDNAEVFETVSLLDVGSVDALLSKMAEQQLAVKSVAALQDLCRDEAKRFWRLAVAEGRTEMSFEEYLKAIHAS